ncbi:MAG: M23 family metallopeptidase [Nitrospirota bacterium]|nr:M23 family metallopeptidase [Nitrospirota bacterium]
MGWTRRGLPLFLLLAGLSQSVSAAADSIETEGLGLPLLCTIGETCWVANYVDADPSVEARDFRCNRRTYDGHDGTDFAIRDLAVMTQGMPVVAGAAGTVRNVRDGMPDVALTDEASRKRLAGRECGNGVVMGHEGNWQTQYCHMRQGSIKVKAGDKVERGSQLGLVGLSGKTEFPHVHLTVRKDGNAIDPFTNREMIAGCGKDGKSLWRADQHIMYEPVALYNVGFATDEPDIEAIRSGKREEGPFPSTAPALVLWVDILGVETGDRLLFRIIDGDGKVVFNRREQIERTQARRFAFAGSRPKTNGWPAGTYTGQVTLTRTVDGKEITREATRSVTVR